MNKKSMKIKNPLKSKMKILKNPLNSKEKLLNQNLQTYKSRWKKN